MLVDISAVDLSAAENRVISNYTDIRAVVTAAVER